jgi:hypothetical protein
MNDPPPETDDGNADLTEVNDLLHQVIRSLTFHEGMIADLLQMLAELDAESIGRLRVQAAVELDEVHRDRHTDPLADERESYWRHRFCLIDKVLARRGSYFQTAEVVSLDAVRRK